MSLLVINTIEDIAHQLLKMRIPFGYDTKAVTVSYGQSRIPAFMACYHTETGALVLTDGDYNIITKQVLIDHIQNA